VTTNLTNLTDAAVDSITCLAIAATDPTVVVDGQMYAVPDGDGGVTLLTTPAYDRAQGALLPARVARKVTVVDAASLLDYIGRYDWPESLEVWASLEQRRVTAILDSVDGNRDHTAVLSVAQSREWIEWARIDGKLLDQVTFAQFIEDHLSTIGAPDGAKLLDICQTLEAHTEVAFKMQNLLPNGARVFRWEETIEGKAGEKGDLPIPAELVLVLRPFMGSEPVEITAKFRYRINSGGLTLGVHLIEPDVALETAFASVVATVQAGIDVRVNNGVG